MHLLRSSRYVRKCSLRRPTSYFSSQHTYGYSHNLSTFTDSIPSDLVTALGESCAKKQTNVNMETLLKTGYGHLLDQLPEDLTKNEGLSQKQLTWLQVATFLHREMPVRFAKKVEELDSLPYALGEMESLQIVKKWYVNSYRDVVDNPEPKTAAEEENFRQLMQDIYTRHDNTLVTMAQGLKEWKRKGLAKKDLSEHTEIHEFLDEFFISRVGIRILIGQYLELHRNDLSDEFIGLINTKTSPYQVASSAVADARYVCERSTGLAPHVEIKGNFDLTFPYVPSHLYYILFEVLKNSMRATVDRGVQEYGDDVDDSDLADISLIIADGEQNEDVVIKVSDEGGGIKRSNMNKIFSYLFTTATRKSDNVSEFDYQDFSREAPLAGMGYGLPIGRGYARYFGGDLQIISMEGYGTDAYLHLSRLTNNREPLK